MQDDYGHEDELDILRNVSDKKRDMGLLNQKKVSKWEMDELFAEEEEYLEEF